MKYTKEERLDISYRIYDGEFTIYTASQKFTFLFPDFLDKRF